MAINIFKLEEYLGKYEFTSEYLLCSSDSETFSLHEILAWATPQEKYLFEHVSLCYTQPFGLPALRDELAQQLYLGLSAENIICFTGAQEGIYAALHVLCTPKDHVIVLTPCYQSLQEVPRSIGCDVTSLVLQKENQWRIDIEAIKKSIKPNTKCVVINFPHNPTGQIITQQELNELITVLVEHNIWLFSDEVYRLGGNPETPWAQPAATLYNKALSLGVMSKAFGLAGLRLGWIACQDTALLDRIKLMKDYLSISNSALSEIVSLIALRNKEKILMRNNELIKNNLQLVEQFFARYADLFSWVRPQGGCVGFVEYKGKESIDDFCNNLREEQGVLLLPGSVYDYPGNYFRIGFGKKNMPEALQRLETFVKNR